MAPAFAPGDSRAFRQRQEQLSSRQPSRCEFLCVQLMDGDLSPTAGHLTANQCPDTMQLVPTSITAAPPLQSSPPPPRTCVRKSHCKRSRIFREWCRGYGYLSPPWPLCLPRWSPGCQPCTCGRGVVCEWTKNVLGHPTMGWCMDRPHSCHLPALGPIFAGGSRVGSRLPRCLLGNGGTKGRNSMWTRPCYSLAVTGSPRMVAAGQARRA